MMDDGFERVAALASGLPEVARGTSYGTPSLKVTGKSFCRMKDKMDGVLVVTVPLGLKEVLLEAEPQKYFETPHYAGWPAMLVRLDAVNDDELKTRLACAWAEKASAKLKKGFGP